MRALRQCWVVAVMLAGMFGAGSSLEAQVRGVVARVGGTMHLVDRSVLFQDTAMTIPVTADGDPVAAVRDKSGFGRHLFQPTSTARPLYKIDANGNGYLQGDGVDDWLRSDATDFMSGTAATIVSGMTTTGANAFNYKNNGTGFNDFCLRTGSVGFTVYNGSSATATTMAARTDSALHVLTQRGTGANWITRQDGVLQATRNTGTALNFAAQAAGQRVNVLGIGAGAYAADKWYGSILLKAELDDADMGLCERLMARLTGITL